MGDKTTTSLRIDEELFEEFDDAIEDIAMSRSEVMERMIEAFLYYQTVDGQGGMSAAEVLKNLEATRKIVTDSALFDTADGAMTDIAEEEQ